MLVEGAAVGRGIGSAAERFGGAEAVFPDSRYKYFLDNGLRRIHSGVRFGARRSRRALRGRGSVATILFDKVFVIPILARLPVPADRRFSIANP